MELLIVAFAGVFAGIATGLVGLSAAAVIVPILTTLLGVDGYLAVGIALASDVVASFLAAKTYHKHGNVDVKNGISMMISVVVFTLIASYVSSLMNTESVGSIMNIIAIILGIKFYFKNQNVKIEKKELKHPMLSSILWGALVGIICGYIGAGGGVMLLMVLVKVLGYDTKIAVGTSVFIMGFTALTGAVSHIIIGGTNVIYLTISVVSATLGAMVAAKYANKISQEKSNKVVGIFLIIFGIVLTIIKNFL